MSHPPHFLSHGRGPAVPVTVTVWNLAGVGSQWIDERAWKRTPPLWLLGGREGDFELRRIDQNRTYSLGRTWQHRSHCSTVPVLCQTVLFFFSCVNLSSQWNLYDPSSQYAQEISFNSSLCAAHFNFTQPIRASLFLVSCVYPTTLHPQLASLPCLRPAPIGYHLTWHCVLGPIQWQRHCFPFFGHCILSLKPLSATFPVWKKKKT